MCSDLDLSKKLASIAKYVSVKNGECILRAGERTEYICLVISGVVRGYYLDDEGNDITKCFSMENDWCCSYSYMSKLPSPFFIETIDDTILARFDINEINTFIDKYPVFRKKVEQLLGEMLVRSEQRIRSLMSLEAKDRYLMLLDEQPELFKRVKQEYIASYIGVTPSSLSRIKKSL